MIKTSRDFSHHPTMDRDSNGVNNGEKPIEDSSGADSSDVNINQNPAVENSTAELTGGDLNESVVENGSEECRGGNLEESIVKIDDEGIKNRSCRSSRQPEISTTSKTMDQEVTVEDLPEEVLIIIFSHINNSELALNVRHVSQRFQRIVDETPSLWRNYTLRYCDYIGSEHSISLMKNMPGLKHFDAHYLTGRGDAVIQRLASYCNQLTTILIPHLWISGESTELIIESFPCLAELHLALNSQMERQIKAVGRSSSLVRLHLLPHPDGLGLVTPGLLVPLAEGCPELSTLFIYGITNETEDVNNLLIKKKNKLECLGWRGSMHSSTFVTLGKCTALKDLRIWIFCLTDVPATSANIPELNLPNIESVIYANSPIQYLPKLIGASLPTLVSLTLNNCSGDITSALTTIFPRCKILENLSLSHVVVDKNVFTLLQTRALKNVALLS